MKIAWKKKKPGAVKRLRPNLPFEEGEDLNEEDDNTSRGTSETSISPESRGGGGDDPARLAESFRALGDQLAEKRRCLPPSWETIGLERERLVIFVEGATELEPSWAEAWITLARAQLNYGEPDTSIESFDKALSIKPDSIEAQADRETALNLIKKRKRLHLSGLDTRESRYAVRDKAEP
ncbi:hypothetical protein QJS10_CPB13g00960 [Acorus calamus]|uniref:Tetratricopeptide repeat protein 33 n=1 Tax=Acorus calamus TaxID=4465 RepID=A0AAV9DK62_ACOCL|nr:hypothetical protein QJS10_CPB13g00960 [Acorus calamus]